MAVNACDSGGDPTLPATWRLMTIDTNFCLDLDGGGDAVAIGVDVNLHGHTTEQSDNGRDPYRAGTVKSHAPQTGVQIGLAFHDKNLVSALLPTSHPVAFSVFRASTHFAWRPTDRILARRHYASRGELLLESGLAGPMRSPHGDGAGSYVDLRWICCTYFDGTACSLT